MRIFLRRWLVAVLAVGVVSSVRGGDVAVSSQATPESVANAEDQKVDRAALEERVDARWEALIKGDYAAAYEMELPSYRKSNTFEKYRGEFGDAVTWRLAKVAGISYDGASKAKVSISVEITARMASGRPETIQNEIRETWVRRDGQWWHSNY